MTNTYQNVLNQFKIVQNCPEGFLPCPKWSKLINKAISWSYRVDRVNFGLQNYQSGFSINRYPCLVIKLPKTFVCDVVMFWYYVFLGPNTHF